MAEYRLVSLWQIEAPLHDVYDAVFKSLRWPSWWRGAEHVEQLDPGDANGIGSIRRYTWKSRMAYQIRFDARATRIEPLSALEAHVTGDLEGKGRWAFSHDQGMTTVRYEWHVRTTKRWMNLLAPLAGSLFERNHHALMQSGAEGLARLLGARLVQVSHHVLPGKSGGGAGGSTGSVDVAAAMAAGVAAGIIATAVQLALWWACAVPLPDILYRDARLAAAIVLGRAILPPPATFEWSVMAAATIVHVGLSACYGLIVAAILSRLDPRHAQAAGALFGLFLYGANMYGFTALFPWFAASRDWITMAAHVAFGIAAAWIYRRRRRNMRAVMWFSRG